MIRKILTIFELLQVLERALSDNRIDKACQITPPLGVYIYFEYCLLTKLLDLD